MINISGLIKKINMMPNSKEKAIKICLLYSYINFLIDSRQLSMDDANTILKNINEMEVFIKHYVKDERTQVNSILDSTELLNFLYEDILKYANNYPLFNTFVPKVNIQNLMNYAKDFLNYIDPKALDLFNKLIAEELIVETIITDYGGKCHKLNGEVSGIIIRYDTMPFYKIFTLIHEMGHAYYHYLNKSTPNLIRTNIANECMPRIFEQLFLLYLKDNYLIDENSINQYERFFTIHQLNITNSVYIINKLLINDFINPNFHIENIKSVLSFKDYYDLSIIKPKNNDFQQYLSFNNNYYSYAYLLSSIVRENFIQDPVETKKFIKEIPFYAKNNSYDFINLFDKNDYLNATKKNISRVLSKTHYKK